MDIQLRKTNQALLGATLYINSEGISNEELRAIETLLQFVSSGSAESAISDKQKIFSDLRASNIRYFSKNPHNYIVVVGECKIKRQNLVGIFRSFGIESKNLKMFTNYEQLKNIFPFIDIKSSKAKAVLMGSVPHSVTGLNGHASPKQAIEAVSEINGCFTSFPTGLKITKEGLHEFIINASKHLQGKSP